MGKLVFQVGGAFSEFERSMIRQRIKAGLKRAVAQGTRLGKPKVDVALEHKAQKQLKKGVGILKVAQDAWARDWHGSADQAGNRTGVIADSAAAFPRRRRDMASTSERN